MKPDIEFSTRTIYKGNLLKSSFEVSWLGCSENILKKICLTNTYNISKWECAYDCVWFFNVIQIINLLSTKYTWKECGFAIGPFSQDEVNDDVTEDIMKLIIYYINIIYMYEQ